MERWEKFDLQLNTLAVFRGILQDEVFAAFKEMIAGLSEKGEAGKYSACASFAAKLYGHGDDWSEYMLSLVLDDENPYVRALAKGEPVGSALKASLDRELDILGYAAEVSSDDIAAAIGDSVAIPEWRTSNIALAAKYAEMEKNVTTRGYGIYARHHMFTAENGVPVPVRSPDKQSLAALTGYERERGMVVENTLALIEGRPASNMLLYGDAGTGKSSTIKAVANEFCKRGLRLVEIQKHRLHELPALLDTLADVPLKFILFIDDLSFTDGGDDFTELKAVLEGGLTARSENIAIYATSNRRHLVRESMEARNGDDLHVNDTLQETMSLSARFGITVTFLRPEKELYLQIAHALAHSYGLEMASDELDKKAEAFALKSGGRSPRTARQFIEFEKSHKISRI